MSARFSFTSPGFCVEFRGTEDFVREQIEEVRDRIREALRGDAESAPGGDEAGRTADTEGVGKSSLEDFFEKARVREGRGALQDSILIFAHYMHEQQGKHEFSIEDLNFCFDLLDIRRPKSLANTLGILKRDRQLLHGGSRRGTYALTERGQERVKRIV